MKKSNTFFRSPRLQQSTDQNNEQQIRRCMTDCGFSRTDADEYIRLSENGSTQDSLCLLRRQRNKAMDRMRAAARQVDCIDFLIHELETEQKERICK